jgi:NAD(P)-dependent dehydrogenase (short-subunit alcohol dehydrogenase family)
MSFDQQHPIDSPFGARPTALDVVAGVDLSGKTAIITGASSGIGIETARALASAGAEVILPVRDPSKGEATAADLRASIKGCRVRVAAMDLSDLDSVRRFAESFLSENKPLHILINNAGIMAGPLQRTPTGWELQFATNHLGHFLLTVLLIPALKAGSPSRIVSLSSIGHRISPVDFDDIHFQKRAYDKWKAYGQAKTANALFAVELDRRLRPAGVAAFAVHPGGIMTGLQKDLSREEMAAFGWIDDKGNPHPQFKSLEQGAATSVWAATSPALRGKGGLYLEDCNIAEIADESTPAMRGIRKHAIDPAAAERLWAVSEEMLAPWLGSVTN